MIIEFAARHFHAPDTVREYAEKEVGKFKKYNDRVTHCQIILEHEHNEHTTEIKLSVPGNHFFAKAVSSNLTKSIDLAVEKTMHQLKKHKEISQNHKSVDKNIDEY
jgi:ribosomal subunit interface protein